MKIKDRLDNFLYDREYKIIIQDGSIDIINYNEIVIFTFNKIVVRYKDRLITVDGLNLSIKKMLQNEVLITGNIFSVSIK